MATCRTLEVTNSSFTNMEHQVVYIPMSLLPKCKESPGLPDTDVISNKKGYFRRPHFAVRDKACEGAHHSQVTSLATQSKGATAAIWVPSLYAPEWRSPLEKTWILVEQPWIRELFFCQMLDSHFRVLSKICWKSWEALVCSYWPERERKLGTSTRPCSSAARGSMLGAPDSRAAWRLKRKEGSVSINNTQSQVRRTWKSLLCSLRR